MKRRRLTAMLLALLLLVAAVLTGCGDKTGSETLGQEPNALRGGGNYGSYSNDYSNGYNEGSGLDDSIKRDAHDVKNGLEEILNGEATR